jgi:hypothetical protein
VVAIVVFQILAHHQRGRGTLAGGAGYLHGGAGPDIAGSEYAWHAGLQGGVGLDHADFVQFDLG